MCVTVRESISPSKRVFVCAVGSESCAAAIEKSEKKKRRNGFGSGKDEGCLTLKPDVSNDKRHVSSQSIIAL